MIRTGDGTYTRWKLIEDGLLKPTEVQYPFYRTFREDYARPFLTTELVQAYREKLIAQGIVKKYEPTSIVKPLTKVAPLETTLH